MTTTWARSGTREHKPKRMKKIWKKMGVFDVVEWCFGVVWCVFLVVFFVLFGGFWWCLVFEVYFFFKMVLSAVFFGCCLVFFLCF